MPGVLGSGRSECSEPRPRRTLLRVWSVLMSVGKVKLASVSLPLIFLVISGNESIESASSCSYSTLWQGTCNGPPATTEVTNPRLSARNILSSRMLTRLRHKSLYCSCNWTLRSLSQFSLICLSVRGGLPAIWTWELLTMRTGWMPYLSGMLCPAIFLK